MLIDNPPLQSYVFFSESRITELCFWGDRLEDASWTSWLGIWDGALKKDWYFWGSLQNLPRFSLKTGYYMCTGIFCTCLLMEDMGNNAKLLCIVLIWYFHVVMYITSFPKNLQTWPFQATNATKILWHSILSHGYPLIALPKNQGVAWDKHIWSRPTRRNASNWFHWCLRCFFSEFSSLRWAATMWRNPCCLLYGCFLKWWVSPTTMGFPTKNDHFGMFGGYHHLRKHPYPDILL